MCRTLHNQSHDVMQKEGEREREGEKEREREREGEKERERGREGERERERRREREGEKERKGEVSKLSQLSKYKLLAWSVSHPFGAEQGI